MLHFQYITFLYGKDGAENIKRMLEIKEWLRINVGKEGDARKPDEDFDWAWSLTSYHMIMTDRVNRDWKGIYFKRSEDKLRFRLSFNLYQEG